MNRISIISIYILVLLKLKQIEAGNPKIGSVDHQKLMSKDEVLQALQNSVRGIIESGGSGKNDKKSFKRYFRTVKSLGYCMASGDMTKQELVSCLNTVVGELGIVPPVQFMTCLGDYIMCTSQACFRKLQAKKTSKKAIKCVVKCLPRAVMCISRSGPSPKRYKEI